LARWYIATNTAIDPDVLIRPDDGELGELLIAAARGEGAYETILDLFTTRARKAAG
jgi:hypothetical protein